jgi:hypothetical protein
MEWEESYSLLDLRSMTGAAGGWDRWLLENTFGLFLILGPWLLAMTFLICYFLTRLTKAAASTDMKYFILSDLNGLCVVE